MPIATKNSVEPSSSQVQQTTTTSKSQGKKRQPNPQYPSQQQKQKDQAGNKKLKPPGTAKLRGMERDSPEVRVSKTLSWLLRHGAQGEGLAMRRDGYVKVDDILNHPKLKAQSLSLDAVQGIVQADSKQRYDLVFEADPPASFSTDPASSPSGIWWIKARQGHSLKMVQLDLKPVNSVSEIPSGIAVHGTSQKAWQSIEMQGLSKMKRNHIHLAQGVASQNVISGMRNSSQILVFINVQRALDAGIKFYMSDNGVVLTEGDDSGFLKPEFFARVENSKRELLSGWAGDSQPSTSTTATTTGGNPINGGYETPPAYKAKEKPPQSVFEDLKLE